MGLLGLMNASRKIVGVIVFLTFLLQGVISLYHVGAKFIRVNDTKVIELALEFISIYKDKLHRGARGVHRYTFYTDRTKVDDLIDNYEKIWYRNRPWWFMWKRTMRCMFRHMGLWLKLQGGQKLKIMKHPHYLG